MATLAPTKTAPARGGAGEDAEGAGEERERDAEDAEGAAAARAGAGGGGEDGPGAAGAASTTAIRSAAAPAPAPAPAPAAPASVAGGWQTAIAASAVARGDARAAWRAVLGARAPAPSRPCKEGPVLCLRVGDALFDFGGLFFCFQLCGGRARGGRARAHDGHLDAERARRVER